MLDDALAHTGLTDPATGEPLRFTPHDFRRMFITDAILNGLPPHIAQVIAGHHDINVTLGYKAVYPDEAIQAHLAFLARRRALRPSEEYRDTHRRGMAGVPRPLRTPQGLHRHLRPRVRHPLHPRTRLRPLPDALARPDPTAPPGRDPRQPHARIAEAEREGWLGEVEGLHVSLAGAEDKLAQIDRRPTSHARRPRESHAPNLILTPTRISKHASEFREFGFTTMPFGRALAPGMLFRSGDHAQAAARIGYGIATRGITVITGEVGVGKTVAARAAIDRAEPARHHLIYIPNPTVAARGIYHHIVCAWAGGPASTTPPWSRRPATHSPPKQPNAAGSPSCASTRPTSSATMPSKPCGCSPITGPTPIPFRHNTSRPTHARRQNGPGHPGRARPTDHRAPHHDRHDQRRDRRIRPPPLRLAGRSDPLFTDDAIALIHNPAAASPAASTGSPSPRSSPPAPRARTSSTRPAPDPRRRNQPRPPARRDTLKSARHSDHRKPRSDTTERGQSHTRTSLNGNDATMCKISDAQHVLPRRIENEYVPPHLPSPRGRVPPRARTRAHKPSGPPSNAASVALAAQARR